MEFIQDKLSKNFSKAAQEVINKGIVDGQKGLAEEIGFNKTSLNSVLNGKRNVPFEFAKNFQDKYKIQIIENIEDSDIQNRLLRIEANLEVFQVAIAGLKAKKTEDFDRKFSELQTLIEEAVTRRRLKSENSSL